MLPGVVSKLSVITVIVLNADTMLSCKLFKRLLGKHGLCSGVINLEVHKMRSEEVVHKTVQYLYRFLVRDPFNWAKKPTSADSIWSTETISPGLVAMKIL